MNITVVGLLEEDIVRFNTTIGEAFGLWRGEKTPAPDETHSVEFELVPPVELGVSAVAQAAGSPSLRISGSQTVMVVLVDHRDEDGVLGLRLANDCLFLADCIGSPPEAGSLIRVQVAARDFRIYPFLI